VLANERALVRACALLRFVRLGPAASEALPRLLDHAHALESRPGAILQRELLELGFAEGIYGELTSPRFVEQIALDLAQRGEVERAELERFLEHRLAAAAVASVARDDFERLRARACEPAHGSNELNAVRLAAASCLAELAEEGGAAFEEHRAAVIASLASERPHERIGALVIATALRATGKRDVHPAVAKLLGSSSELERALAAHVLEIAGAECDVHGAALEPLLDDPSPCVRAYAAAAVHALCGGSPRIESVLTAAIADPDSATKLAAIDGLQPELFGGPSPPEAAFEPLVACLASKDPQVQIAALGALGAYRDAARKAVPRIQGLAKKSRVDVARAAKDALERIR
jgi:hypothetical protein